MVQVIGGLLCVGALLAAPSRGPVVVLDPGHGGAEAGAVAASGAEEKRIALAVAAAAKAALEKANLTVVLTRSEDVALALPERVAVAARHGAAVFVSIHANSSPVDGRRGVETYVLASAASDDDAQGVADVENSGSSLAEPPAQAGLPRVLEELVRERAREDSAALAGGLQRELGRVPELLPSRGLRQGPFLVLRLASVPAALVELGYLTNPEQAEKLALAEVQVRAGRAIARAIVAFLRDTPPID